MHPIGKKIPVKGTLFAFPYEEQYAVVLSRNHLYINLYPLRV